MTTRLTRRAGTTRARFDLEVFESRVLMDASYQFLSADSVLKIPTDRSGGVGASDNITVLDDVNGDGVKDIAASGTATVTDQYGGQVAAGLVNIYSGKDGSIIRTISPAQGSYAAGYGFAARIALGGDMDSDGVRDLIVSDYYNVANNQPGAVRIYSARTGAQLIAFSVNAYAQYLGKIADAGDLDADGKSDILVTGGFSTSFGGNSVLIRAYSGRTGSLLWEAAPGGGTQYYYNTRILTALVAVPDQNADGKPDILVGGDDVSHSNNTFGGVFLLSGADGSILRSWDLGTADTFVGTRIAYLGDTNHDGVGEFAVLSYARESGENSPLIATALLFSLDNSDVNAPRWTKQIGQWTSDDGLGQAAFTNVGDLNADGINDLGVMSNPSSRQSTLKIYSGTDGALLREVASTSVRVDRARTSGNIFFGSSVAVGDLDSDGFAELIVGAQVAESPREGQITSLPFIAVIPTIQYQTPVITGISATGIVSGTIGGHPFFSVQGLLTTTAGVKGALPGDIITDYNNQGIWFGATDVSGANSFFIENGVRTLLSSLPIKNLLSSTGDFSSKPAGSYGSPVAFKLAAGAKLGLVKILRDATTATTWLFHKNSTNSGYELVYLFDGDPVGISLDGYTAAANRIDGAGVFLADALTTNSPQQFSTDDFRATIVAKSALGGYSEDGKQAKIGFVNVSNGLFAPTFGVSVLKSDAASIVNSFKLISMTALPTGSVLTFEPGDPTTTQTKLWVRDSGGVWTPTTLLAANIVGFPGPVTTFTQSPQALSEHGAVFTIATINAGAPQAARLVPNVDVGPFFFDSFKSLASSPVGATGAAIVGFNAFGELIYLRRDQESDPWVGNQLAVPAGSVVYDVAVWDNGVGVATDKGLLRLIRAADGSWDTVNLTTTISGASGIGKSLRAIVTIDKYIILAGVNADNEVVIYGSTSANPDKTATWSYDNLSNSVLTTFNIADPKLQGDLITYVTPWNGLNIAGINDVGEPVTFWTAPGVSGWRFTNLAEAQEDRTLAKGFSRLTVNVTPWGGVSITGADSSLRTVWWAPALGGVWKFAALADVVQNSPRPQLVKESVVAFATTWGGQNIAGTDTEGHVWVYWWSPESNKWVATSLQTAVTGLSGHTFSNRLSAYATTGNIPMAVTAIDTAGDAIHMYFKIGTGWLASDATQAVDTSL